MACINFEIRWSFPYPENCTPRKLRALLAAMATLWQDWLTFPWYLTRTLHRQIDRPSADWDHLHTLLWMRAFAASVLLDERYFEDQEAVLRLLIEHQVQFVGILRHLLLDHIRWCLNDNNLDRLPDCALVGANTPESAQALEKKRLLFQKRIEQAVSEFVRVLNFASETGNPDERIAGHPLRLWYRGAHMPDAEEVPVRMITVGGRVFLRPVEQTAARFLSRRLQVPRVEVLPDGAERAAAGSGTVASAPAGAGNEPVDEAYEARRLAAKAIDIATRLDLNPRLKAPTHAAVLQLYCIKGLSIQEIQKELMCSHGTVMNRKRTLENQLGNLEQFQNLAVYMDDMDQALRDPRARAIYRRGQTG